MVERKVSIVFQSVHTCQRRSLVISQRDSSFYCTIIFRAAHCVLFQPYLHLKTCVCTVFVPEYKKSKKEKHDVVKTIKQYVAEEVSE